MPFKHHIEEKLRQKFSSLLLSVEDDCLKSELNSGIHALCLKLLSPEEAGELVSEALSDGEDDEVYPFDNDES